MSIVAFLQNQWFKNPEKVARIYNNCSTMERRARLNSAYLFYRCVTGHRLKAAFGEDLCDRILWENVSPKLGSKSCSVFPPDLEHIQGILEHYRPKIVLVFGKVAEDGIVRAGVQDYLYAPHPAARSADVMSKLKAMRVELCKRLS